MPHKGIEKLVKCLVQLREDATPRRAVSGGVTPSREGRAGLIMTLKGRGLKCEGDIYTYVVSSGDGGQKDVNRSWLS